MPEGLWWWVRRTAPRKGSPCAHSSSSLLSPLVLSSTHVFYFLPVVDMIPLGTQGVLQLSQFTCLAVHSFRISHPYCLTVTQELIYFPIYLSLTAAVWLLSQLLPSFSDILSALSQRAWSSWFLLAALAGKQGLSSSLHAQVSTDHFSFF